MMCFNILVRGNKINGADVSGILKAGSALDLKSETKQKPHNWMEDK